MLIQLRTCIILAGIFLVFSEPLFSQNHGNRYSLNNKTLNVDYRSEVDYKKNVLKIAPGKLILGGINLSYERIITSKTSLNFRVKFHPLGFVERSIDGFSVSGKDFKFKLTERPRFHHFGFDTEYRFYMNNKNTAKGFYVAPYLHYLNYAGKFESNYSSKIGDLPVDVNGSLKTTMNIWGIGVQTGVQWRINDRISIDWGFAGLGVDRYSFGVEVMSDNLESMVDKYSNDLQNVLGGESGFLARKLAFYILDDQLSSSVPFWMLGWKSFLTVGIAF
jgi:hypothetical protein